MFYYPNVLHRHTGCFSTIWLAATGGIRITRRELLRVNVKGTCGDIMDYLNARVPPPQPHLPKPLFSLYLSSQLQCGVVIVYHRQCGFLLEEIQQTINRLMRSKSCMGLDMAECDRLVLDVPDNLCMMTAGEGAQNPFFGLMEPCQLLSPFNTHQPMSVTGEAASQHSLLPSPHTTPDKEGFQSPPAAITMIDTEQLLPTTVEHYEGDDLPEATAREIDLLLDQPDQFRNEGEEPQTEEAARDLDRAISIDQLKETVLGAERDGVYLLDEETGQPVKVPLGAAGLEVTPTQVPMPTPPSGTSGREEDRATESLYAEVVVPPRRKPAGGRRRQLVFADPEVQISDGAMKEQIRTPLAETVDLSKVLLDLFAMTKHATPAQLFSAPCGSLLHADLRAQWKQHASLSIPPGHGGQREEEDKASRGESEQDREILRTEWERRQSILREISNESGLQPSKGSSASDVISDMSREDKCVSDAITPVSKWSPQEEARPPMEPIAEETIGMPEAQPDTESCNIRGSIISILRRFGEVTFGSLLPPEASRTTAARTLYRLLVLRSAGEVTVQQTGPYSDITINPGPLRMAA